VGDSKLVAKAAASASALLEAQLDVGRTENWRLEWKDCDEVMFCMYEEGAMDVVCAAK
jgi:hypothetical protein